MSEAKHTPGPWRLEPQHCSDHGQFFEDAIWAEVDGNPKHIANVRVGLPGTSANGLLIAG